jgi:hypothetical protein
LIRTSNFKFHFEDWVITKLILRPSLIAPEHEKIILGMTIMKMSFLIFSKWSMTYKKMGNVQKRQNTKAQPTEIHQTKKTTCQTIYYLVWYCKLLDIHVSQRFQAFQIIFFPTENRFGEQKQQTDQIINF